MALFVVSYDLHINRVYQPLWDRLRGWNAAKLLESLWLVELNGTAAQVRDALKDVVDNDDSIAVVELKAGSDWAGSRAKPEGVEWLRRHVRS